MSRNLRLQVMLNAVDRVTGPLKKMREGAGQTAQAMRETQGQLKELQRTQSDLTSYRKARIAERQNIRAMRDARAHAREYTQALERQREAHGVNESALKTAKQEYRRLSREMLATTRPSKQLTDALERSRIRLDEHQRAVDESSRAQTHYRNKVRNTDERIKQLTQTNANLTERTRGLKTRLDEAGISTDNLGRSARELRTREDRLNTTLQEQKRHLSEVAQRQRRLTEARDRYQNGQAHVARAQGVGMGMFGTGIAQGYMASRVLRPGVAFGESMSAVQALTRLNEDDEAFLSLKRQAREMGATTAFSGTEVADSQGFLAMAGFEAAAIETAIPDVLNLALATGTDLARTADISSNILSGFGLDPDQMARVSDVLTATATRANVDLGMLGDSMKYVAPQAKAMGMSLEQASAMAGLLGNVGIQGSQAGTTLRAMVTRLAAPVGKAAGSLETLGISAKDAQGDLRDIPNILSDVAKATKDMGNADRAEHLKNIFGEEPGAGLAELIEQQGAAGIEAFVEVLNEATGEASRVAKTRADNIGGDLKSLRSAWEDVGISITETNKGPIRDLIQNITKITRGVSAWIEANPELAGTIAKVAAGMIALATIGGAVTMTFASILSPLLFARFAMASLGIRLGGVAKGLSGLGKVLPSLRGGLAASAASTSALSRGWQKLGGAWKRSDPRRMRGPIQRLGQTILMLPAHLDDAIKATGRWVKATGQNAQRAVTTTARATGDLARNRLSALRTGLVSATRAAYQYVAVNGLMGTAINGTRQGFSSVSRLLQGGFNSVMGTAGAALRVVGQALLFVGRAALMNPIGLVITAIAGAALLVYKYWEPIKAFFAGFWRGLREGLQPVAESLAPAFEALGSVLSPLKPIWDGIASAIGTVWGWISNLLAPVQATGEQLDAATSAGERLGRGLANIINVVSEAIGAFVEFGGNIISGLISGITDGIAALRDRIVSIGTSIMDWFKGVLGIHSPSRVFAGFGANIVEGIIGGISNMAGALRDHVMGLASNIASWMGDVVGDALSTGREIASSIGNGIADGARAAGRAARDAGGAALDTGRDIASGMANGIRDGARGAWSAVRGLAQGTEDTAREQLDTHSPSRVFKNIGTDVAGGLRDGIAGGASGPLEQVRSLTDRLKSAAAGLMLSAGIASPAIALEVERPTPPDMPRLYSEVATPETPTLDALQVERPALPALGTLEIQRPELPQLTSEVAKPETPTLNALQVERPALPTLGALEIQRPELPRLYSEVATPEKPTLDALQVERPDLPTLGALEIQRPELPQLTSEMATPETPTLDALQIERPALPELGALEFEWPELPQFDPLRIDTSGLQLDARPPLQSHPAEPSAGLVINGGINIEIHAAPGMNEQDLARLVNAEVQRALRDAERRAQASRRSAFHDID